jgi:hypothetical protein
MPAELVYPYRSKPMTMIGGILFFGAGGLLMLYAAATNTDGLLLEGFIRLEPGAANVFYYGVAAVMLTFVVLGIHQLYMSLTKETSLRLGPSAFTMPVGFRKLERRIAYADIKSIQHRRVYRQEFITITPRMGKALSIGASLLPSKAIFTAIRAELAARAKTAQNL